MLLPKNKLKYLPIFANKSINIHFYLFLNYIARERIIKSKKFHESLSFFIFTHFKCDKITFQSRTIITYWFDYIPNDTNLNMNSMTMHPKFDLNIHFARVLNNCLH